METCQINSPLGIIKIVAENAIVSEILFAENSKISDVIPDSLLDIVQEIKEYFDGSRKQFTFKNQQKGTAFQQKVWQELQKIPYGKTISYLELAKKLGNPKVIRAAASANGKNKLLLVVPCHRVLGSNGALTGFACGLWRKKLLLDFENPINQESLF